jgi:transcriptional regulator with GAF, ATPase, and Fis domain
MRDNHEQDAAKARLIADATTALTTSDDIAGVLARLLDDCANAFCGAAGIMLRLPDGGIEVSSASSHQTLELELFQSQTGTGPCLECVTGAGPVVVAGLAEITVRWPKFGQAMAAAGYATVHAQPMSWQRSTIGGLNIFRRTERPLSESERTLAQIFADIATVAVVHTGMVDADEALRRSQRALASRNVIEQAKGFLAYEHKLDMAAAYEELRAIAERTDRTLTDTAADILSRHHPD